MPFYAAFYFHWRISWNEISKIREETDGMKQIGRLERNKKDEKGQQIIRVDPLKRLAV